MDLAILNLGQALDSGLSELGLQSQDSGFQSALQIAQSPPGLEPPPPPDPTNGSREEKQTTNEPTAQSNQPDLSSAEKAKESQKKHEVHSLPSQVQVPLNAELALSIPVASNLKAMPVTPGKADISPAKEPIPATPPPKDLVSLSNLPQNNGAKIVSAKADDVQALDAKQVTQATNVAVLGKTEDAKIQSDARSFETTIKSEAAADPESPAPAHASAIAETAPTSQSSGNSATNQDSPKDGNSGPSTPQPAPMAAAALQAAPISSGSAVPSAVPAQSGSTPVSQPVAVIQAPKAEQQDLKVFGLIADHVETLAAAKVGGDVTVHLQADDLTSVILNVKTLRGQVEAQITTDNPALRNALHQNRPQLAQSFEARGMNLGQVSVGLQGGKRDQSHERHPSEARNQFSAKPGSTTSSTGTNRHAGREAEGVDLWI